MYNKKANAAYLMGVYEVTILKRTAEEAMKPFKDETFVDFRDALKGPCSYACKVLTSPS